MSEISNEIASIKANVKRAYNFKVEKAYRLCLAYAGYFKQRFRQKQAQNAYWNNQTGTAYATVESGAEKLDAELVAYLMQTVDYGLYLELANNRKHEAIRPTVMAFYSRFMRDVEKVFGE